MCLASCENRPQHTAQEPQTHQKFESLKIIHSRDDKIRFEFDELNTKRADIVRIYFRWKSNEKPKSGNVVENQLLIYTVQQREKKNRRTENEREKKWRNDERERDTPQQHSPQHRTHTTLGNEREREKHFLDSTAGRAKLFEHNLKKTNTKIKKRNKSIDKYPAPQSRTQMLKPAE